MILNSHADLLCFMVDCTVRLQYSRQNGLLKHHSDQVVGISAKHCSSTGLKILPKILTAQSLYVLHMLAQVSSKTDEKLPDFLQHWAYSVSIKALWWAGTDVYGSICSVIRRIEDYDKMVPVCTLSRHIVSSSQYKKKWLHLGLLHMGEPP